MVKRETPLFRYVLVAAGLFVIAALVVSLVQSAAAPKEGVYEMPNCVRDDLREPVRTVMLVAAEQALRQHVVRMFEIWMKDPANQPQRAAVGTNAGVDAYVRARASIEKWSPKACP